MTNATKTLALIFAGTVVLALAASWGGGGTSSAAFRGRLLAVDSSAVQAVRIERPDGPSLRLARTTDGWAVSPADASASYPADSQAVRQLLSTLPSLQVSAVPTRQPDKHPRYGVDSTGTTVTMLGRDDEPLGRLIVGRTRLRRPQQSRGRSRNPMRRMRRRRGTPITYVRTPDRPDVYSVERALGRLVNRDVESWRDKQIWAVGRQAIRRVDFGYPADSSFIIRRAARPDTAAAAAPDTWLSAGDTLSSSAVSSALRMLSVPQASGFAEEKSPDTFGDALYTLRLHLADGSTRTLRLRPSDTGDAYLAVADGYPYVARLAKGRWDRSVLKGRSALLRDDS